VFSVKGDEPAWSARGRLAVVSDEHVRVLSEHGKPLSSFPGRAFAWSPHGDRVASLAGQTLTVRGRVGGGRVIFRKKASGAAQVLFWADAHRVVLVTSLNEQIRRHRRLKWAHLETGRAPCLRALLRLYIA
jgi:hypothetical protein